MSDLITSPIIAHDLSVGKVCGECGEYKLFLGFYRQKPNGFRSICKKCSHKIHHEWARKNKIQLKEYMEKYKANNPDYRERANCKRRDDRKEALSGDGAELFLEKKRDEFNRWKNKDIDRYKERNRKGQLAKKGVTQLWYEEKLTEQSGSCAICGTSNPGFAGAVNHFAVDHDHSCCPSKKACDKCFRGLLCSSCNTRLAHLEEEIWTVKAVAYLDKYADRKKSGIRIVVCNVVGKKDEDVA